MRGRVRTGCQQLRPTGVATPESYCLSQTPSPFVPPSPQSLPAPAPPHNLRAAKLRPALPALSLACPQCIKRAAAADVATWAALAGWSRRFGFRPLQSEATAAPSKWPTSPGGEGKWGNMIGHHPGHALTVPLPSGPSLSDDVCHHERSQRPSSLRSLTLYSSSDRSLRRQSSFPVCGLQVAVLAGRRPYSKDRERESPE